MPKKPETTMPEGDNTEKWSPAPSFDRGPIVEVRAPADGTVVELPADSPPLEIPPPAAGDTLPGLGSDQAPPSPPAESAAAETKALVQWAQAKGHIPSTKRVRGFGGSAIVPVHGGRHVDVIRTYIQQINGWPNVAPPNLQLTEAEYDKFADEAYGLTVR